MVNLRKKTVINKNTKRSKEKNSGSQIEIQVDNTDSEEKVGAEVKFDLFFGRVDSCSNLRCWYVNTLIKY